MDDTLHALAKLSHTVEAPSVTEAVFRAGLVVQRGEVQGGECMDTVHASHHHDTTLHLTIPLTSRVQ